MLTDYMVTCPHTGCHWTGILLPKDNRDACNFVRPTTNEIVFECPRCRAEWRARVVGNDAVPLRLLDRLTGCSLEEKAELFQTLARELIADSDGIQLLPIRSATGTLMGYYLMTEDDGLTEIDLSKGVAALSDPDGLVPIKEVLASRAWQSSVSPETAPQV